jgi:hypothetical protein
MQSPGALAEGRYSRAMAEVMRERVVTPTHRCDHLVQVYRDHAELAESVATFFGAGFEAGQPAVAVATTAHWPAIAQRLDRRGWNVEELQAEGVLHVRDAHETLAAISDEHGPSVRKFNDVVGGLLDLAVGTDANRPPRAFGEMVDILVRRGERKAADTLEGYWNKLGTHRDFTLLCAYEVDLFDLQEQISLLPQVYRSHTHVLPAADEARMEAAVGRAFAEVLGEANAAKVYTQAVRGDGTAPASHLALMWISAHMPRTAADVLAVARARYADAAAA